MSKITSETNIDKHNTYFNGSLPNSQCIKPTSFPQSLFTKPSVARPPVTGTERTERTERTGLPSASVRTCEDGDLHGSKGVHQPAVRKGGQGNLMSSQLESYVSDVAGDAVRCR